MVIYCNSCPKKGPINPLKAVKCQNCDAYYHKSCSDRIGYVTEGVIKKCCFNYFNLLNLEADHSIGDTSFTSCTSNNSIDLNLTQGTEIISQKQDLNMTSIESFDALWDKIVEKLDNGISKKLDDFINSVDDRFQEIQEQIDEIRDNISKSNDENIEEILYEQELREKKKKYVLFVNIPDLNKDDEDKKFMQKFLDNVSDHIDISNIKTFRLGRYLKNKNPPRLLKVQFKSSDEAQWILHNKKSLKSDKDIYCKADLTYKQRSNLKKAIIEIKDRENKGEKNLAISYINNMPKVVESKPISNNVNKNDRNKNKNKNNFR